MHHAELRCLALVAMTALAALGCGEEAGSSARPGADGADRAGGKVASCHAAAVASCREYRGANLALGTESLAKLCTAVSRQATFAEAPCPTARLVATCARKDGTDFFYEGYPLPGPDSERACAASGGTYAAARR